MPKNTEKKPTQKLKVNKPVIKMVTAAILLFSGLILLISFVSYLFHWKQDQSQLTEMADKTVQVENVFGKVGANLGEFFINEGIGVAAFFIPFILILLGIRIIFRFKKISIGKSLLNALFFSIWLPLFFAFILSDISVLGGRMGTELNDYLMNLIDYLGIAILLLLTLVLYGILEWGITPEKVQNKMESIKPKPSVKEQPEPVEEKKVDSKVAEPIIEKAKEEVGFKSEPASDEEIAPVLKSTSDEVKIELDNYTDPVVEDHKTEELIINDDSGVELKVEKVEEEETVEENISTELVKKHGEYDPWLDLPNYKFPSIDLLNDYSAGQNVTIDQRELETNKNKIVETLGNYGINIDSIKATIGPTVTLYEIVPEAGVRISKIKNLEDDIALSLSALGIRIIAPIPGRGTIGIEVPNSNPTMVSMRSVIASQKFQSSKMELPIAFGKTIANETFVADLAKMPHMLMAGATGQGKSVGINAIIASLLYKKHPSELKFVLVDPKKVELALYNKIERHYLAKLPDTEDAIITDNTKVINTLNSLCIEMDERYDLLKNAYVRNIREYNEKFRQRKLNPEKGHRYLPYIVLVVDEFADLIMTAGKEVETPIARLAQLARAVGIHLIIATQRPSVNVITGIIKANFPARVAFRVTSKIDSRTILDSGGADQLIGKGDMLFTTGNELVRLQCAFIDTPEVEEIAEYIGSQKAYPDAFLLPEYMGEESGNVLDIDPDDRDALFEEAARIIVSNQQGSASLLQRKMKIGYNRAGRIIDQLEAAGIVGPFEGSKARDVLIQDEGSLEQLLKND